MNIIMLNICKYFKISSAIILLLLLLTSCFTVLSDYCTTDSHFAIGQINGELSNLDKKNLSNFLINNSGLNIEQNNNKVIDLDIKVSKVASVLSSNTSASMNNLIFLVNYKLYDKDKNIILDSGRITIVDTINISNNRFADYIVEENLFDNFYNSLSIKLKNRLDLFLNRHFCK